MITSLLAVALVAQATGPVLTLDEALRRADSHNLELASARSRLAQAKEITRKAWAGYLPQVSVSGQYMYSNVDAVLAMPTGYVIRDVGVPTSEAGDPSQGGLPGAPTTLVMMPSDFVEAEIQKNHQLMGTLQLQQALIVPSLWPAIANASLAVEATELNVQNARREILFATAQMYYSAVTLREAIDVQTRLLEVNEAHVKDAEVKVRLGTTPRISLLRAQIDEAQARQNLRRSELGYASTKSALATLLARDPDFEVVRPPEPASPENEPNLGDVALRERYDVQASRVNVELAEGTRRGSLFSYLPTLALIARANASNAAGFTGSYVTWTAGLALNWTLWDGGLREAELREANAKIDEARFNLEATELKAKDEVRRALLDLETARSNSLTATEQLKLARENSSLVQASFEAGVGTYLEVVDATAALTGAELSNLTETLNIDLAVLKLARAAGLFEPVR